MLVMVCLRWRTRFLTEQAPSGDLGTMQPSPPLVELDCGLGAVPCFVRLFQGVERQQVAGVTLIKGVERQAAGVYAAMCMGDLAP